MAGLAQGDPRAQAREIVLRKLSASPRSRVELERALGQKGIEENVAAEVLDHFTELQLIDDQAYAEVVVRSQRTTRGLAARGLAHELRKRGVDDEVAARALEQVDPEDELASARALVAKRLPATAGLEPVARMRRLTGMLARKGYGAGTAMSVVREALAAEGDAIEGADEAELDT